MAVTLSSHIYYIQRAIGAVQDTLTPTDIEKLGNDVEISVRVLTARLAIGCLLQVIPDPDES
jgi:hypothetical protein